VRSLHRSPARRDRDGDGVEGTPGSSELEGERRCAFLAYGGGSAAAERGNRQREFERLAWEVNHADEVLDVEWYLSEIAPKLRGLG
jgi:hypothetical protein